MATIPSHATWMADTYSLTSPRSDLLKKVDEAVKAYEKSPGDAGKTAIKTALDRWRFDQSRQGKDWTKSVRNQKNGAVSNLHRAVSDIDKRKLTQEERDALDYIALQQRLALQKQLMGKEVRFKRTTVIGMANSASTAWDRFKTGSSTLVVDGGGLAATGALAGRRLAATGSNLATFQRGGVSALHESQRNDAAGLKPKIIEFIRSLCPGLNPQAVFDALHLGNVEQFAVNLAPFIGTISSGGKAIVGWIGVAAKIYEASSLEDRRFAFRAGDPEAAFDAVIALLDREIKAASIKAGVHTTAFTGKALGMFADGGAITGPVIGALETLAQIFQTIVDYVRDYREVKRANKLIRLGAFNLEMFKVCPVLGCYFLVIQDHSTIINFAVSDYGTPNWMMDVERLVKQIQVVLEKSRHYIKVSRFEMPGMEHAKGIQEANWSHTSGLAKVTGAPGAAVGAIGDGIMNKIDSLRGKPSPIPKVDKSRIVGFGSDSLRV